MKIRKEKKERARAERDEDKGRDKQKSRTETAKRTKNKKEREGERERHTVSRGNSSCMTWCESSPWKQSGNFLERRRASPGESTATWTSFAGHMGV